MTTARVTLWGSTIGAVSWHQERRHALFEYDPTFVESGIQLSPITMPLAKRVYAFAGLARSSFEGLPGLVADALPDRFGNALIDAWLVAEGRDAASFDPVERLCYIGERAMGALEFEPAIGPGPGEGPLDVDALVRLASEVLSRRESLHASLRSGERREALRDILRVGSSAGGARAKALVAWNPKTHELRSGPIDTDSDFEHWLLKFDGVSHNKDKELADPEGYGLIELAYHTMARAAGVEMSDCRVLEESGRHHFMTRRFDRVGRAEKVHMQSLAALGHFDFDDAGAHSYEEALTIARRLGAPMAEIEQLFRRAVFNIVARNQDDHVKNIAFLMDRRGRWRLSPAFDVTYAYNPTGAWTNAHQMSLNGKRDGFERADLVACARRASMKRGRAEAILEEVTAAVATWREHAAAAGVADDMAARIGATHRLGM